ncbi:carboxypeptidase regulatory-like domain-containing protein [Bacteroides sp. 519]|uniref:carboxypeptidase regulatory-like domain-containing protein n=1 Tax=Bacteroides sp. 519 TaxID=2302937 RepID=UPI0013D8876A|nr:carboxypeptidase regulatory-like domain-containing protein [Bacteroides sp. 519]NDV59251.1 carboxypeptidase-like regulatory domain-containing protein [Bacteroides sp. 519]
MKQLLYLITALLLICSCSESEKVTTGNIYGTVSDKSTGELVPIANVLLKPGSIAKTTGTDGSFEFIGLEAGTYTIEITKESYNSKTEQITIVAGQDVEKQIIIERIPAVVTVDRDILDFGDKDKTSTLSFSIVNSGYEDLVWSAEYECPWIKEINPSNGTLKYGKTEPITVVIDRVKLAGGDNETKLVIKSTNGRSELTIKAIGEIFLLPVVVTKEVEDITSKAATFHGEMTHEGNPVYSERGFVYATIAQPTIEENTGKLVAEKDATTFSSAISELTPNTVYYVRTYAINEDGVSYGNDVTFTTEIQPTTVVTSAATDISMNAATFNGKITDAGIPTYSERGFCYDTSNNLPTIANTKKIVEGSDSESYSIKVSGLTQETTYHIRAYAIQGTEVIYGNEVSFSTTGVEPTILSTSSATDISANSATLNASIIDAGIPAYSERGFCYSSTTSTPTISDIQIAVTGQEVGNYSTSITGLVLETTYYVRAYVKQGANVIYGNTISFTTVWVATTVTTSNVTNLGTTTATLNGVVTNKGTPGYSERGFCYSSSTTTPTINNDRVSVAGMGVAGNFKKDITGLRSGEIYYVRAYVIQDSRVVYGNTVQFVTVELPVVYTNSVTNITSSNFGLNWSAIFNGTIQSIGYPGYTERGFVYNTYMNPTVSNSKKVVSGKAAGTFYATITNLSSYKTYYVRAYAKSPSGTIVYGDNVSFRTY